jgi:hypothetical protein
MSTSGEPRKPVEVLAEEFHRRRCGRAGSSLPISSRRV